VFNINTIKAGELDFGVAQSDVQYNATKGARRSSRTAAPRRPARGVLGAPRAASPCWRARKPTSRVRRLQGQALQRRQPGLGHARVDGELLPAMGWKLSDFSLASELKADEHGAALCDNKIDGFFYGVGHPSANIQDPITTCGAKLVPLTGPAVDKLVAGALLRQGQHSRRPVRRTTQPDPTYGVLATFVTSSKVAGRHGVRTRQGGVRQLRRVQEAAPGLWRTSTRRTWSRTATRRRCTRAPSSTTRKRAGCDPALARFPAQAPGSEGPVPLDDPAASRRPSCR
jgi:TRAP-type uncharacterized transport system substrate-binding protein